MCFFSRFSRFAFLLASLAAVPVLVWSQVAMVNVTSCGPQGSPLTCTVPSTGSGNLIVVGFQMSGSTATTITSVTDNAGNVYVEAGAARAIDTVAGTVADIWYARNSLPGATSLTITPNIITANGLAVIWELSGIATAAPLDQSAVLNNQSSTTLVSGAPVTTTSSIEAIVSIAVVGRSVNGISAGNPFVADSTLQGNGWAHLITSSAGTYSPQWPQNPAATYAASTASFKAVSSAPGFTVSVAPASATAVAGSNGTYSVTVTPSGGFAGAVSLSAGGLPPGATTSFSPASITTSGTSVLTLSTASTTPAASYPLTVTGTSGSLIQTAAATLVVSSSSGGSTSCDLNKDGTSNVVDVQLAVNNYLSCPTAPFQTFVSQVIGATLNGSCSATGLHVVSLKWTASTTPGVTYNVYRTTTSGGYTTPLNSSPIAGTAFTDCTVVSGQAYYYVTRTVDSTGAQSANSNETTVTIPSS